WNGKSWGMISVGSNLHMWFTIGRPRAMGFNEARIATSSDNGKSWKKAGWAFTPADRFLMPSFMQVGKNYTSSDLPGEIMNHVYSYHTRYVKHPGYVQSPGRVELVRVPKGQVGTRAAYEFFAGLNGAGQPIWTKDLNQRQPVLEKPYLLDAPPTVSWNPHLKRFIMVMGHVTSTSTANIGVGFYEAEQPWGPWYRIKEQAGFAQGTIFFYQLPTKWMNPDLSAWMAFTGPDKEGGEEWDALDVVNIKFVKAGGGDPAPTAVADSATTEPGAAVKIPVLANDTGSGLTVASITTPANGTKKKNGDQTITYTPKAGYTGTDSFRYTAKDSSGRTASAAVSVTVSRTGPDPTIKILEAIYGTTKTCDPTPRLRQLCDGKTSCSVLVGSSLCGDPDYGKTKTLAVNYSCGSIEKNATQIDHYILYLACS
ncbi:MAG: Ig-like domain-containing protein, partial [Geminicoccaceae bacterium]